jgi:hypothetical protein
LQIHQQEQIRVLLSLSALAATSASASQITIDVSGETAVIIIQGRLYQGDDDLFRARIADLHKSSVLVGLNSPGGDLRAGIEIGTIVRMRGFATVVPVSVPAKLAQMTPTPRTTPSGLVL